MESLQEAYNDGFKAFENGLTYSHNPYEDMQLSGEWIKGYSCAVLCSEYDCLLEVF